MISYIALLILGILVSPLHAETTSDIIEGKIVPNERDISKMFVEYLISYQNDPMISHISKINKERYEIFKKNVQYMIAHNKKEDKTYEMGINKFAGLTNEEMLGLISVPQDCSATKPSATKNCPKGPIPGTMDWRDKGVVTKVKNQGGCGSCWSFSTTGAVESHYAILKQIKPPIEFSEQQLIDCSKAYGNKGCNGGLPSQAFEYIKDFGSEKEEDYPYQGRDMNCRYQKEKVVAQVPGGSFNITQNDENKILEIVGTIGPVSIAFDVVNDFFFYKKGIYQSKSCRSGPQDVNHAVLNVGYGAENGVDYWIVKNSWGQYWGENGYFRILRGKNMCGLAACAAYPLMQTIH